MIALWGRAGPGLAQGTAGLAPIGQFYDYVTTIFVRRRHIKDRDKAAAIELYKMGE